MIDEKTSWQYLIVNMLKYRQEISSDMINFMMTDPHGYVNLLLFCMG